MVIQYLEGILSLDEHKFIEFRRRAAEWKREDRYQPMKRVYSICRAPISDGGIPKAKSSDAGSTTDPNSSRKGSGSASGNGILGEHDG